MKIVMILMLILLAGCGTSAIQDDPDNTDVIIVTTAKAGGVVRMINGDVSTCKVTIYGRDDAGAEVRTDNGSCNVVVIAPQEG